MLFLGELELPTKAVRSIVTSDGGTYPAHDVIQGKPKKQFIGAAPTRLSIACFFHVEFIQPRATYDKIQALSASGAAVQAWTRAGAYYGTFVIDSADFRPVAMLDDGRVFAAHCSIELSDAGDPALEVPTPPAPLADQATARDTVSELPTEDTSRPIESVTIEEIARV